MIRKAIKNEEKLKQMEVASRIVWTTPKNTLEATKDVLSKETSTEILKGEKHVYWDTEANEFQETSSVATNVRNESIGKIVLFIIIFLS